MTGLQLRRAQLHSYTKASPGSFLSRSIAIAIVNG
jgi:hypothetical protein